MRQQTGRVVQWNSPFNVQIYCINIQFLSQGKFRFPFFDTALEWRNYTMRQRINHEFNGCDEHKNIMENRLLQEITPLGCQRLKEALKDAKLRKAHRDKLLGERK